MIHSQALPAYAIQRPSIDQLGRVNQLPCCRCLAGHYCPTVDEQIECPAGSFCPEQTVEPRKCPWLTRCPKGTDRPAFSAGIFVFVVAAAIATLLSYLYVLMVGREQDRRAARAGEQVLSLLP